MKMLVIKLGFSICILCVVDSSDLRREFERGRNMSMITVTD